MHRSAFSLVELSIVLVILGLLTGGILAGQSLIRAAELRSVSTEYQRYVTATQTFRDKYLALPGDMPNATRFWGDDNSACADAGIPNGTPGTCNGNGDGMIHGALAVSASGETFQLWKQLALAGLIEGNYTGISGTGSGYDAVLGTNVPVSKLSNAGWSLQYVDTGNTLVNYTLPSHYGNVFIFGTEYPNWETGSPALRPEEAWNIDTKLDDGLPASGRIIGRYWNNLCSEPNSGAPATTNLDARYRLTDSSVQCSLFIKL